MAGERSCHQSISLMADYGPVWITIGTLIAPFFPPVVVVVDQLNMHGLLKKRKANMHGSWAEKIGIEHSPPVFF